MKKNALQFIIDSSGNYLDYSGSVRALSNYVGMVQIITPLPLDDAVGINFIVYDSKIQNLSQYVIPTAYKGRDVIPETDVLYQTVYNWNVFEVEIFEKALSYISKHHQGRIGASFTFEEIVPSARAVTYKGLFGSETPLPTTGMTTGDYYVCEDYNYNAQGFVFGKGQIIYWNGTKWIKDRMVMKLTTATIDIPVDPTLSVEYELTLEEINYLASIGADVALLGQRMTAAEGNIENIRTGDFVLRKISLDTDDPAETLGIGETRWNAQQDCLETRISADVVIQHGQEVTVKIRSDVATQMNDGSPFCISGGIGGSSIMLAIPGSNENVDLSEKTIGLTTEVIAPYANGHGTIYGLVNGIKTDYATWVTGQQLWLGNGNITNVRPAGTKYIVRIGIVGRVHGIDGSIFVSPRYYPTIDQLSRVNITNGAANDILVRMADGTYVNSQWLKTLQDAHDAHVARTDNPHAVTKSQVGLGNVDNTSDVNKPVSTLQAAAIVSAVSNHNSSGSAHEDIRNMIAALVGAYVYRGTIAVSNPSDVQLTARIVELLSRQPAIGDVLVDIDKNEWYFNGTDWNNYGQFIIGLASATSDGLMTKEFFTKLDDLYSRVDLDQVLATKVDKVIGKSLIDDLLITKISEQYSRVQLDNILSNIYTKPEVDAILNQLKAIYGWKDSDLGYLSNNDTIAISIVDQYDFIVVQIQTDGQITSKIFAPSEINSGEAITEIINTTPTVTSIITKGATNYTFTISSGTATAHLIGVKMDYGLLNEVRQVGTTTMSFVNGKLTSVVSDNVNTYLSYDTNGNVAKITETYADGKSYETTYTKDVEGRIKSLTKVEV
jgi:hypothetical protein